MGAPTDEIDRQIGETRDNIDQNLGVLERRAASNAMRYARVAAVVLGVVVVAGAGVLVYRRISRPSRREQLRAMLIDALKELPDTLRDLPDEVTSRLKKPLPSIKVVPAFVTTASGAFIDRFIRQADALDDKSSRGGASAFD